MTSNDITHIGVDGTGTVIDAVINTENIIKDVYMKKEEVAQLLYFAFNNDEDSLSVLNIDRFMSYMCVTRKDTYMTIEEDRESNDLDSVTWDLIMNKGRLSDKTAYSCVSAYLFENIDELNKLRDRVHTANLEVEIPLVEFYNLWNRDASLRDK